MKLVDVECEVCVDREEEDLRTAENMHLLLISVLRRLAAAERDIQWAHGVLDTFSIIRKYEDCNGIDVVLNVTGRLNMAADRGYLRHPEKKQDG